MNNTTYTRRDMESIYEYLKAQATELSEGRWTDFSSGDIGSVLLGLMAYLADANNFQIDKAASELFLDTAVERSSIMSILKLIGYKPRHYESAYTQIHLLNNSESEDVENTVIPAFSTFTNDDASITYTNLSAIKIVNGEGYGIVHEGKLVSSTYTYSQISDDGRIYLPDYKIGTNTVKVRIRSVSNSYLNMVDDVRFSSGAFDFSVHVDEYARVYIQLPAFWADVLDESATVQVYYLLTLGEAGRIGAGILTKAGQSTILSGTYDISNPEQSTGGYFPETTDELRINAPKYARTMYTIVTKKDMEDLVISLPDIANIKAGDYNDNWTGYAQPDDAYKCKVLAVPTNVLETSLFENGEPTPSCKTMMDFIDERRLASLMITYEDPKRNIPNIKLNIYINEDSLSVSTIASSVEAFMKALYDRSYLTIGKSLYGSVIGRDVLNAFAEIDYLEVEAPKINIEVDPDEYIDMYYAKFRIYVNDELKIDEWN